MKPEFEISEQLKPLPRGMDHVIPAIEGATIIKKRVAQKEQLEAMLGKEKEKENNLLGQLATYVFLMERALERFEEPLIKNDLKNVFREFRVLKNQMLRSLEDYGVSIEDPSGNVFDDNLEEKVDVIGWVSGEGEKRVRETHEPIILKDNVTIKLGQVIVSSPTTSN